MSSTKSVKKSALIMVSFIVCIISMGCTKTEMTKQEQTGTEQLTAVSETEALTTEKETDILLIWKEGATPSLYFSDLATPALN